MNVTVHDLHDGVVLLATRGPWQGYYVLLEQQPGPGWIAYWRDPAVDDDAMTIGRDVGDRWVRQEDAESLLSDMGASLLGDDRAQWARRAFFSYAEALPRRRLRTVRRRLRARTTTKG